MKLKKRLSAVLLVISLVFAVFIPRASAWNSHGMTLYYCLGDISWLSDYSDITVTEYSYSDVDTEPYNPDFKVQYLDGEIGEKTSAFKILTTYADEPDWDMDTNLNLSRFQMLTGGSQGYRHQYYRLFFIRLGVGPHRAQYWYDLAKAAYKKGDLYWTFRFLARSLHHVQDLTNPYHGVPAPAGIILKNAFKIGDFITTAANHHYNMEEYQGLQIEIKSPDWLRTLLDAKPMDLGEVKSVEWLAAYGASLGRPLVRKLWPLEEKFFGKGLSSGSLWLFDKGSIGVSQPGTVQEEYDKVIFKPLERFSIFSKTLLEYAKSDLGL